MTAALSVQQHTITLGAGVGSNTADLTGDPGTLNTDDCIPFITAWVTTPNGADPGGYAVDAYFTAGSPNKVTVETGDSATRALSVEVTVVEFDSSLIKVQQGTFSMTDGSATPDVVPDDLGEDTTENTFLYHTYQCTGMGADYHNALTRGNIFGVDNFSFSRSNTVGTVSGNFYLAEANQASKPWSVQHINMDMTAAEPSTTAVGGGTDFDTVDATKSFMLGSFKSENASASNAEHTVDTVLDPDGDLITKTRQASADIVWGVVQLVTFDSGGNENVYRGTIVGTDGDDTVSIGATVVDGDSTVHVAGMTGGFTGGSFAGTAAADCPNALCTLTFPSATQVQIEHDISGTPDTGNVSWEVIEWDTGAAPPVTRRVMVRG